MDTRALNDTMKKNIFLMGGPSSGKTAVIKKVMESLNVPASGFYTEEEREASKRVGFVINTLDGKRCRLAHRDITSVYRIRRYGISIENIESVAVPAIAPVNTNVIILDGIGDIQCISSVFKKAVLTALDSPNIVLGTITRGVDDFIMKIIYRSDVEFHEVTRNTRKLIPDFIIGRISELLIFGRKKFPT